ncbi:MULTISPECIES: glutamate--tRNA ligase [Pseudarthrobacter]|jgi:glutamyl-tRNA synthetase|uniref:Glutamate--tRNA ligase n=1 Tax=Pseudarthrobacter oxydans TaxID=1671 RepID=A0AAW8ND74_PSEOX|nr:MULTISPECIES: glutamate--tRNA ligase [Pseudarthrobacter]MDV2977516.1 glutamate--tRNA ligase [Actinomycetes bacterium ARC8]WHP57825.1 glutamate--tRNA ligase [Arthrobacter sp. KFRI-F3372]MDR6794141.1 glutamyl-tRNA synthetase [Pseudarthrobacter oxydans]MDR7165481.1 glutamyl-tRNA synthetase [Pseudarthrobacter oxydans]NSX36860.1 glutamate--tRNA ligase [Pseudarthrobacter oxydans]
MTTASASNAASLPPVSADTPVRVRFCPSPTGTPHVGLIRTALFNWAHAKHTKGTFVFRIEDTDAARDSEESYLQLLEALKWLGITWEEGVEVGGPHEPYRQSQRLDLYKDVVAKLIEGGYAYECYSSPEEVEARHRAAGRDPKLGYDNFDRELTDEQVAAFKAEGRQPVLRVRMPDEDVTFTDLVRGEITFKAGSIPDYVIVRADGSPLYTLVNPVDDALMGITHVLRGEDLLSSTPRQVVLIRALMELGVASYMPEFGHLPYVMGEGNKKLSKRDPQSNLFLLRDRGFIPEGLLNYLSLLGWSLSADEDIFTVDQLIENFDVHDVLANPARFDIKKAEAINGTHIRMLAPGDFRERLVPYLRTAGYVGEELTARQEDILTEAAPLIQERITLLGEAPDMLGFLFKDDDAIDVADDARKGLPQNLDEVLDAAIGALDSVQEWTAEEIQAALKQALVEDLGLKPRLAFGPVRTAVSGRRISPPLFESMVILGRESSLRRLRAFRG